MARTHIRLYAPFEQHTHYMVYCSLLRWQRPASRHPTVRPSWHKRIQQYHTTLIVCVHACAGARAHVFVAQDMRFSEQFIADNKNARSVNALLFQRPLAPSLARALSFLSLCCLFERWLPWAPSFKTRTYHANWSTNKYATDVLLLLLKYKKYRFNINRFVRVYFSSSPNFSLAPVSFYLFYFTLFCYISSSLVLLSMRWVTFLDCFTLLRFV